MADKEHIPLNEWREKVSPIMDQIQWEAMRARHHATMALSRVQSLPCRPEWRSLALDEIDKAIKATAATLQHLMDAKKAYDQKKVAS